MELPRSCTDVRVAVPCSPCNGNGGHGHRTLEPSAVNPFRACSSCGGTGWDLKAPDKLTEKEREYLFRKLPLPSNGSSETPA